MSRYFIIRSAAFAFRRLVLGEYGLDAPAGRERVWEWHEDFLALNPARHHAGAAGREPVSDTGVAIIADISTRPRRRHGAKTAVADHDAERIEVRRLMAWFTEKFYEEATHRSSPSVSYKRFMSEQNGARPGPWR